MDPLHAISVPQPEFSVEAAEQALALSFDLHGELRALLSERDQNFRLVTAEQDRYVFKIANRSEPAVATDFQIKALLHIEQANCAVPTPRIRRTVSGQDAARIGTGDTAHNCRVVSYLAGELLSNIKMTAALARQFGKSAAALDLALADFEHAGQEQVLLWDVQRAAELRKILEYVKDEELRAAAESCLSDFEARVLPALPALRHQVIHGDLNPDNVLAGGADTIAGVIDFGDMLRAPLIMEVAVAAAYLRPAKADADVLAAVSPFVAAYHAVLPLQSDEIDLLFDLIRARLVATITILRWRAATRGAEDDYSSQNLSGESDAEIFFERLNCFGRDRFCERIHKDLKIR